MYQDFKDLLSAFHAHSVNYLIKRCVRTHPDTGMGFLSTNWRWCQYGYVRVVSLAASREAICSSVSFHPAAPKFCRNCSSLRAPRITLETVGRCKSQLRAICTTLLPVSFAMASMASTTVW